MQTVRAKYEDGVLRLLEPVHLEEGQEVTVSVASREQAIDQQARLKQILGDLVDWATLEPEPPEEIAAIREALRDAGSLSDVIIDER
jgi:predicted DNA-binding antitoxin AbrB/MazE fold protein